MSPKGEAYPNIGHDDNHDRRDDLDHLTNMRWPG